MPIYVEQVFINNFVIDFSIIVLCSLATRQKFVWYRVVGASTFGAIFAMLLPLTKSYGAFLYLQKIICAVVMCIISNSKKSIKKFVLFLCMFIIFTFMFGGMSFALVIAMGGSYNDIVGFDLPLPIWAIILGLVTYAFFVGKAIQNFFNEKKIAKFNFSLKVFVDKKSCVLNAYLDTGNILVDTQSNKGVVVVDYKTISKVVDISVVDLVLKKNVDNLKNSHYIPYTTISGKTQTMLVFEPDCTIIDNKRQIDCMLGISISGLAKSEFDALINPILL